MPTATSAPIRNAAAHGFHSWSGEKKRNEAMPPAAAGEGRPTK